jgi:hypothetical protein
LRCGDLLGFLSFTAQTSTMASTARPTQESAASK